MEDNTQTIWVEASEAGNYRVERIEKLSPEHEEHRRNCSGVGKGAGGGRGNIGLRVHGGGHADRYHRDLQALQQDLDTMSQNVVSGMEMASQISELRSRFKPLRSGRRIPGDTGNRAIQTAVPLGDKHVHPGLRLGPQGIATADPSCITQAQTLYNEGTAIIQSLDPCFRASSPPSDQRFTHFLLLRPASDLWIPALSVWGQVLFFGIPHYAGWQMAPMVGTQKRRQFKRTGSGLVF